MWYRVARGLQIAGLITLPLSMALQLQGMGLGRMLLMAGCGAVVFYLGYLLQEKVRP